MISNSLLSTFIETRDLSVSEIISLKPDENTLPHLIIILNDKTENVVYLNSNSLISSILCYLGDDKEKVDNLRKDLLEDTGYVKVYIG